MEDDWHDLGDCTSSGISVISSQNDDDASSSMNTSAIDVQALHDSLNSEYYANINESYDLNINDALPEIKQQSKLKLDEIMSQSTLRSSINEPPVNSINDSYDLNINDALPMLKEKSRSKMEEIMSQSKLRSSINEPPVNSINDSYDLNINDALTMIKEKSRSKMDNIMTKSKLKKSSTIDSDENIMQILKRTKENENMSQLVGVLAQKQKDFIQRAKNTTNTQVTAKDSIKHSMSLNSDNSSPLTTTTSLETEKEQPHSEIKIISGDNELDILSKEKQESGVIGGEKSVGVRKAKIASPSHDEPSIDLNELLKQSKKEAQLLVSQAKDKNKNFIDSIFDY